MSAGTRSHRLSLLRRAAWRRELAISLVMTLPLLAATAFAAWRWIGGGAMLVVLLLGIAAIAAWLLPRLRALDLAWAARRLDARHPELEDSSGLLLRDPHGLSRLQRLQRTLVRKRVDGLATDELRRDWPVAVIATSLALALALSLAALAVQKPIATGASTGSPRGDGDSITDNQTRVTDARLRIVPPAYTGDPERTERGLEATAAEGSSLHWSLRLDPEPEAVSLQFLDGRTLALQRQGPAWTGGLRLDESQLYRIVVEGGPAADPRMHRLEAVVDQPPRITVLQPDQNVVYAEPDQSRWTLAFEARDDHGLGPAELVLTLAQGSGELVDFSEIRSPLEGDDLHPPGEPPRRHFTTTLEPATLGFGVGDDLVARLEVRDNREPEAQLGRSAAVVLRWPPPAMGEVAGFDGLMQRTMPAYFASQRQIIIDAEALIAQRDELERPVFVARSGDIGADQQLLRLRYGQFMGEESEGGTEGHDHDHDHHDPTHAGTSPGAGTAAQQPVDAAPPARAPRVSNPLFADDAAHHDDDAHDHDDGHDHDHDGRHASSDEGHEAHDAPAAGAGTSAGFGGSGQDVVAQFGHMHDIPEAATLLDPRTRETLRGALRAMWASEGELRMGEPEAALPHAHEALELIQQVRQANRIHLARVGLELPPIDDTRRLSGDLEGVSDRPDPIEPALDDTRGLATLWSALAAPRPDAAGPDFDAAIEWVLAHREALEDPLGLVEAIDALQRDPDCAGCLARLRARLWSALSPPAAGVRQRANHGDSGETYLRRLDGESAR